MNLLKNLIGQVQNKKAQYDSMAKNIITFTLNLYEFFTM